MIRVLVLLLAAAPLAPADPAPEPKRVPDTTAFEKDFAAAVGEHFEFLGGEHGRIQCSMGTAAAERFWVAKVRPRAAGRYVFAYSIRFAYPAHVTAQWKVAAEAAYTFHIGIGKAGERRVFHPRRFGGSSFPYANAGDTLLVPVHTDWYRVDHRFEPVRKVGDDDPVFAVVGEDTDARYRKAAQDPSPVRNAAAGLELVAGWVGSFGNRPGTATHHSLGAYLEFVAPGTLNLGGRLAAEKTDDPGVPFRVVPADRPVTVMADWLDYAQHTGKSRSSMSSYAGGGTLEARVGDRVRVNAGDYVTPGLTPADPAKSGVVEARPFRDAPHYAPR